MRLHHAAVVCHSRENADRFYRDILGLKTMKDATLSKELAEEIFATPQECQFMLYGNDDFAVEVFVVAEDSPAKPIFPHLCMEVADRMSFADRCDREGLEVRRIPRGDTLLIFVKDFDGNLFEVKEMPG
jgi:catechol 2,3-dioxygenase-like lactoylglutathione lyase family enzyme